jgi:AhpD family alkylhydroperoxidase
MREPPTRRFTGIGDMVRAVSALARDRSRLIGIVSGRGEVSPAFRERIMLAVTAVNQCRYCSFVHTRVALLEGVDRCDVDRLLGGELGETPADEVEAVLYAQHWADTGGHPDPAARDKLFQIYGDEQARTIETVIRTIMFGNYFGNAVDGFYNSVSGGRLASSKR